MFADMTTNFAIVWLLLQFCNNTQKANTLSFIVLRLLPTSQKKKLDGVGALEFLDNRTELLVVRWCSSRTQTLLICLSLELTPCWANYPKLFGQTICQMSRALLAHKEEKLRGKTKPAVLSCIPKNTLSIFSFLIVFWLLLIYMLMISCIPAKGKLWISAKNSTHPSPIILDFW